MKTLKKFLPFLGVLFTLAVHLIVPDSDEHPEAENPYFLWVLNFFLILTLVLGLVSLKARKLGDYFVESGPFWFGAGVVLTAFNVIIGKTASVPVLFFPKFDNILAMFFEDGLLILKCILYSTRLLLTGLFFGSAIGFVTGVCLGFSSKTYYWLNPYIKLLGPIPATVWIPIALTIFDTPYAASVFIVALAVWFSVALMTSSAIQAVPNTYYEVARTLGASTSFQIFRVGIPAAMPSIFLGVFYGIISAFLALMTAEMFGAKYGIGWYIIWQKAMMVYSGVYAGLIVIAVYCTLTLTLLFRLRDKILNWQKGIVKW